MSHQTDRRIAIFQARDPVASQTFNSAVMLAEAGYAVELFCHSKSYGWRYVEFERLGKKGVQVYELNPIHPTTLGDPSLPDASALHSRQLLRKRIRATVPFLVVVRDYTVSTLQNAPHIYRLLRGSEEGLLPRWIVPQTLRLMAGKRYRCLIGIEKNGLIWAGQVAENLQTPFMYYSTELYSDDYWRLVMGRSIEFRRLMQAERKYHAKAAATIVQDPERARVLFQENRLPMPGASVFNVPVSLLGGQYQRPSRFLHQSLGFPRDRRVILYFGGIWETRYVLELAKVAQTFPDDWVLVMHGEELDGAVEKIKAIDHRQKVVISLKLVPSDQIQELIASADVGLAFYSPVTQNDRLTAFSSEKMALYMQCGVPFIAFDYPGYRRLANEHRCGLVVQNLRELQETVASILKSHHEFREGAYQAFRKYYDFSHNFAPVIQSIEGLASSRPMSAPTLAERVEGLWQA